MNTTTNEVFTGLWHENVINWGGGDEPLPWGDKNLVCLGEPTRKIFPGEETSKFLTSRRGDSLPIQSSRENSDCTWHINQKP